MEKNNIEIFGLVVTYGDGQQQRFGTRLIFNEGTRFRTLRLEGVSGFHLTPERMIRSIAFTFKTVGKWRVLIGQAEVVADLVDQHMGDDLGEGFLAVGPEVDDRTPIEPDHIGLIAGLRQMLALRQPLAAKQAEKIIFGLAFHFFQNLVVWKVLDANESDPNTTTTVAMGRASWCKTADQNPQKS